MAKLSFPLWVGISILVAACSAGGSDSSPNPGKTDAGAGSGGAAGKGGTGGVGGEGGDAGEGGEGGESGEGGEGGDGGDGGTGATGGTGGEEDSGPPCDKHWKREVCPMVSSTPGASVSYTADNGALVLQETLAPYVCGGLTWPELPLKVYQSQEIEGDFEAAFTLDSFTGAGHYAAVRAFVYETANTDNSAEVSVEQTADGYQTTVKITKAGNEQSDLADISQTAGLLHFARVNNILTVKAVFGSTQKTLSQVLATQPLRIGIAIQPPFTTPDPPASSTARISEFTITGGGGTVVSDTFDCLSIF